MNNKNIRNWQVWSNGVGSTCKWQTTKHTEYSADKNGAFTLAPTRQSYW